MSSLMSKLKKKKKKRFWQASAFVVVVVNYHGALIQALFRMILPTFSAEIIHHVGCVTLICCNHCLQEKATSKPLLRLGEQLSAACAIGYDLQPANLCHQRGGEL